MLAAAFSTSVGLRKREDPLLDRSERGRVRTGARGIIVPKTLIGRWHSCGCGLSISSDHNAARNILRLGQNPDGPSGANGACRCLTSRLV